MAADVLTRRDLLRRAAATAPFALLGAAPPARAGALTLASVKAVGLLRIGCEAAYVPFTFRDPKGAIIGYDVELADLVWGAYGIKPAFVDTAWAGIVPALYAGKFDLIMSSMSYTAERVKRLAFSIPYVEASQALLIRAADHDRIKRPEDLEGKVIGYKLGSPGEVLQKQLADRRHIAYKAVRGFDNHPAAYAALDQSVVDAVFNTVPSLAIVMKDAPGRYALVRGIGADNWAGVAARLDDVELIRHVDTVLTKLKADGRLYKLQEKWFGFRMQLADKIPSFDS